MGGLVFSFTYAAFVFKDDLSSGEILTWFWVCFLPVIGFFYAFFEPFSFYHIIAMFAIGLLVAFRVTGWRLGRPVLSLVGYALTGLLGVGWVLWTWWLWYMLTHLT